MGEPNARIFNSLVLEEDLQVNTSSKQEVQGLMVDTNFKHGSARDGSLRCPPRDQYRPLGSPSVSPFP